MKDMPKQGKGSLLHGEKKPMMTPAEMEKRMTAMAKDMADMAAMMKGHA